MVVEERGERRRSRPFDDRFFEFEEAKHGEREGVFAHRHHAVDERRGDRKRRLAHGAHGEAVGERGADRHGRRPAGGERGREAAGGGGLDGHNRDSGLERLGGRGHAGEQARAAAGDHEGVGVGHVGEDLEAHRPLPRDHAQVVEAVNPFEAIAGGDLEGEPAGVVERVALQDHRRPEPPAGGHLHERCKPRHHHRHGNAEELAVVGEAEGVVAGRGGDDAPAALRVVE